MRPQIVFLIITQKLRQLIYEIRTKGIVNTFVFSIPVFILLMMFYIGFFGPHKQKDPLLQVVMNGNRGDSHSNTAAVAFDPNDPFRYCVRGDDNVINLIVLDESKVVPDFAIHDWLQFEMFGQMDPKTKINIILEKGDQEFEIEEERATKVKRKRDMMEGEREREEKKSQLWKDGTHKNIFCNNSIIVGK